MVIIDRRLALFHGMDLPKGDVILAHGPSVPRGECNYFNVHQFDAVLNA